jgi:hypothetical protein
MTITCHFFRSLNDRYVRKAGIILGFGNGSYRTKAVIFV